MLLERWPGVGVFSCGSTLLNSIQRDLEEVKGVEVNIVVLIRKQVPIYTGKEGPFFLYTSLHSLDR